MAWMPFREPPMSDHLRAWLQIHFCVLLWGFTAILGKAITLSALPLVWWRMTLVIVALMLFPGFWRGLAKLPLRQVAIFSGIGVVVSLHWLTFYAAIKLSNASVGATCMALSPVFTSVIEPFIAGRRFKPRELLFGIAVIPGVALVVGGTPTFMRMGIAVGVISAVFVAIFGSLNKRFVHDGDALTITGLEMAAGAIFLAVISPLLPKSEYLFALPSRHDAVLLLILALGCTLLPFVLSLFSLRHLSAFSTALAVNMEPVYAIALAILLFSEQRELSVAFYVGVAIVLLAVFSHPLIEARRVRT
jgi:drug/metabolite transporter (DMT)-like permease